MSFYTPNTPLASNNKLKQNQQNNDNETSFGNENTSTQPNSDPNLKVNDPNDASSINDSINKNSQKDDLNIPLDTSRIPFWDETQNLINKLEELFSTRVITFYISEIAQLTNEEVDELYNHLYKVGKTDHLILVIYGPGGNGKAAYRIVKLLRSFTKKLTIVVPAKAASAMTMLALGGDEIIMGPLSYLTPIDTSIARHPLAPLDASNRPISVEITEVQKYLELVKSGSFENVDDFRKTPYYALTEKVHPIFLGTVQRSLSLSKLFVRGIAKTHITDENIIDNLVNKLNDAYPIHSYPILKEDIADMGINVKDLSEEQNLACQELLSYYQTLANGSVRVKDNTRITVNRYVFIESIKFRSYVYAETSEKIINNKWTIVYSNANYNRATIVRNKKGYSEAYALSTKEFRKWMKGEEVIVGDS